MYKSVNIIFVLISIVFFLTACSTAVERELSTEVPQFVMLPNGEMPLSSGRKSVVRKELNEALIKKVIVENKQLEILQLSGGGQNGAFGAGFLKGWTESGKRPEFDIVTGVSTGTLISTFAFLGSKEDDALLEEVWMNINRDDIYIKAGLSRLASGADSLYDSEPLMKLLERVITQDTINRIALEYDKGRRLFISTTNLDHNQTWVWDLTAVAKHGGKDALDIYRKAVKASASPPVLFSPVEIMGSLFVDGGARHNLLLVGLTGDRRMLFKGDEKKFDANKKIGNIYSIMHHKAVTETNAVKADIREIIPRSANILVKTSTSDTVLRSYFITKLQGANFNIVYIPDSLEIDEDVLTFNPDVMSKMFKAGRNLAKSPQAWKDKPQSTGEIAPWLIEEVTKRFEAE
jgi:Patatin-like phospholipase